MEQIPGIKHLWPGSSPAMVSLAYRTGQSVPGLNPSIMNGKFRPPTAGHVQTRTVSVSDPLNSFPMKLASDFKISVYKGTIY